MSSAEPTLRTWLASEPRTLTQRVQMFVAIGHALIASHAQTRAHRYVGPANVRVDEAGDVTLRGATIAPLPAESAQGRATDTLDDSSLDSNPCIAAVDAIQGGLELDYAPPELIVGLPYDERSEQFSLCVMLFEAVHGARPFPARTLDGSTRLWTQPARFPRRSQVPDALDRLLQRGLAVPPSERWPSLEAVVDELSQIAAESEAQDALDPRAVGLIALASVAVALALALALALTLALA